jgi:hypothetical protein
MPRHFMNKQHEAHMQGKSEDKDGASKESGSNEAPSIHVHSHAKGHTVHILHPDGQHEQHEHEPGDADGIAQHIHEHIGGEVGQDHGFSSGDDMENEYGDGGPNV